MKKCFAICIYLLLITAFLKFDIRLLFDARQLFLVVLGAALLYLPALGRKQGKLLFDRMFLGQNALWASIIQTFVLLFVVLSEGQSREEMMLQAAMACRPLLYGFCLWVVFSEDLSDVPDKKKGSKVTEETDFSVDMETEKFDQNRNKPERNIHQLDHDRPESTQRTGMLANDNTETQMDDQTTGAEEDVRKIQISINTSKNSDTTNETTTEESPQESSVEKNAKKAITSAGRKETSEHNTIHTNTREASREQLASLGLTKREIEVALLAAADLSNAEIAAELFISETTVKKHLSNIYGKLGISKRGQIRELFRT